MKKYSKITLDNFWNSCKMVYMMRNKDNNEYDIIDYIDTMIKICIYCIILSALSLIINFIIL